MDRMKEYMDLLKRQNEPKIIKINNYPWTNEELRVSYYASFSRTYECIEESKGGKISQNLQILNNSFEITISTIRELLDIITLYVEFINSKNFLYRRNKRKSVEFDFKIMKFIYFTSSSIMSLVDHARNCQEFFNIDDYDNKLKEVFNIKKHSFLQDLRNYSVHKSHITAEWNMSMNLNGVHTSINFDSRKLLLGYSKWRKYSKEFIMESGDKVELNSLLIEYRESLDKFYTWYFNEVKLKYTSSINQYNKYKTFLENIAKVNSWNLAFQTIKTKREFYSFLNKYLELSQLKIIMRFDKNIDNQILYIKKYFDFIDKRIEIKIIEFLNLDI